MGTPNSHFKVNFRLGAHQQRKRQKLIMYAQARTPAPPAASPLKVWDGSQWVPAGVKVEE